MNEECIELELGTRHAIGRLKNRNVICKQLNSITESVFTYLLTDLENIV